MLMLSELDSYLFGQGTHYEIYKKLGSHLGEHQNKQGCNFAVWAPNAQTVSVIGYFNNWNPKENIMNEKDKQGIFQLFIPNIKVGEIYKYSILGKDGKRYEKTDPFANYGEKRPGNGSIVVDIENLEWSDEKWMEERSKADMYENPISILEVHPGAFFRHPGRTDEGFYTYEELSKALVKYVDRKSVV